MFLKQKSTGHMVEVLALTDLFNPFSLSISGRYNHGEEAQDPEDFNKDDLIFLSGESLPCCWTDSHYRDDELRR
ncbi:acetyltransferase [Marinobacterium sedimentorum]|uniref:acetyltransferase n=1 Tax=Marinobacterium sedimentorum TaxID=2927804 RepID=UPI0020C67748|nr:acetyltransferase [Marinobacterium sedimentorum]MCP8690268.1 acetyltransferase [Marinobacterium sedimentorum]